MDQCNTARNDRNRILDKKLAANVQSKDIISDRKRDVKMSSKE